ncbi:bis(5'-nucleosyl)-tetraphosphatase PrpE [Pseudoneobacillus rhizosphaerae]|uniref:Bis(5'-nucleosyl)-tetraphosphatase PrpE [asymmetrical] n=1 Tax=Pseudoneobacillus rhizosphaerae TaxID=2880968 RepID=A0A9C7GE25_9BACI|nr:bis(5'-nucleosyl)-tetraphosphatase PrpE [Pseudoneobacillus rhizosphaerae]CAG9610465.1 Bis(5'-nucleosyl)-tetraphosphatase PrpE [asymmetrical] [Pseudoneobacillus rhizosphaerae]
MKIDIIGDIHGCFQEFRALTTELGYEWTDNIPLHPEKRKLAFVGDLTDRGPMSLKVIDVVWELVMKYGALYSPGNHCNKLYRFFLGNKVQISHGLETTVAEYENLNKSDQKKIRSKFMELYEKAPLYQVLDGGELVVSHAGIREDYIGKSHSGVKTFVLYGDITGEKNPDGSPVRRDWAKQYKGKALVAYGHTPVKEVRWVGNTVNLDTGAVFGGKMSALRYPEKEIVSVPSSMPYVEEKFREIP